MDRQSLQADGMIGPNALTQFRSPLEKQGGQDLFETLLQDARIASLPDMSGLIPEGPVARFHKTVRATLPDLSAEISRAAGVGTADYVLKHRVPGLAQTLLKVLPASVSKHLLANAISKNAWTFAGSGQFEIAGRTPLVFILKDNPLIAGERAGHPICHWHVAVFERLFQELIGSHVRVTETKCGACGADACRFEFNI
jgi:divinyl protochlorophyllide a 8-vinyl-reductase